MNLEQSNENIIDFGSWNLPLSWNDVTLKQWQEVSKYYNEHEKADIRDIVHIMAGKTVDEVNELPIDFLEIILGKLSFMTESPNDNVEPTNKIEVDGEVYMVNTQNKMKTGEYVQSDSVIKQDPYNFAAILAIVCRKEGEVYDAKFENEVLEDRIKMFENISVMKAIPVMSFFLQLWMILNLPSQLFSKVEEVASHILDNIENSQKIGVFRKLYLKWRLKNLLKFQPSIKHI